jgi:hypothetical protein
LRIQREKEQEGDGKGKQFQGGELLGEDAKFIGATLQEQDKEIPATENTLAR